MSAAGAIDCHIHPTMRVGGPPVACAAELLPFADRMGIELLGEPRPCLLPQPTRAQIRP